MKLRFNIQSISYNNFKLFRNLNSYQHNQHLQNLVVLPIYSRMELQHENYRSFPLICQVRSHRYFRRRPINVINHDLKSQTLQDYLAEAKRQAAVIETDEVEFSKQRGSEVKESPQHHPQNASKSHKRTIQSFTASKAEEEIYSDSDEDGILKQEKVFKNLHVQQYKNSNGKIKSLLENGRSARTRYKEDFFLVEGWRLLSDALQSGLKPKAIFFTRSRLFLNLMPKLANTEEELSMILNSFPLYKIPYATMKLWSPLKTPPGIIAALPLSSALENIGKPKRNSIPLIVILDEIRDPNNLGSIIRTLVSVGAYKVIMTKGCCDLWDLKTLRASCGTHFRMHCVCKVPWSSVGDHLPSREVHHSVFLADACHSSPEDSNYATINGNEKLGELRNSAMEETLNKTVHEVKEDGTTTIVNDSYNDLDHLKLFENISIPTYPCHEFRYFTSNVNHDQSLILIIGGETGLTASAKKFALEEGGTQINIPMKNGVESLNSAVATGIIVYEMYRQYKKVLTPSLISENVASQ